MENTTSTPQPRLYRSSSEKVIAGVCGGLAAYFKLDPALVRLAFVVFALVGGASLLLYVVLWIAVPVGDTGAAVGGGHAGGTTAIVLIGVGCLWLLANFGFFAFVSWRLAWPLLLIALGAVLLARRVRP